MTPQEDNIRLQQQVNEELRAYSEAQRTATKETEKAGEVEAKVANLTATGLQILEKLYAAQLKYTISMAKGQKGAAQFNDGIDAMTDAAQMAAVALSLLVPGGALVKGVVAGLTFIATQAMKTAAEMQKAANDQADATYKAYQAFSKAGATGAKGMTGFFNDVNRMRLNVLQMDAVAGAVAASSKEISSFGGTVTKGAGEFADLVQGMGKFEKGMLNLGMNHDEQAEAVLGYMKIQSQLTLGQQRDYGKLSGSARKYIEETEILTRVTGLNRKEQENVRDRQMSQQRSGAAIEELMDQNKGAAVKLIQQQATVYAKMGPMAEQGYNDILSGNVQTEAARKLMNATQGKVMQDQIDIIEGRITSERDAMQATQETAGVMGQMRKDMGGLAKAGVFEEVFLPFKEMGEAAKLKATDLATAVDRARKEVDALTGATGKTEAVTDKYTNLLISQNEQMLALQRSLHGAFSTAGVGVDGFMDIVKNAGTLMLDLVKQGGELMLDMASTAMKKIREMLGIDEPKPMTEKQQKLADTELAARKVADDAAAARDKTEAAKKSAEEAVDVEQKTLNKATIQSHQAKIQLEGSSGSAGINRLVELLQRKEREDTAKVGSAGTEQERKKAQEDADKTRLRLNDALVEQRRLQGVVAEQDRIAEAAKNAVAHREAVLAEARKKDADAKAVEHTATQKSLQAQARAGMGGERPDAMAARDRDMQRQAREKDTAALGNVNQQLTSQRENLKANTDALAKLDKTRDKATIESLERINQTISKRTKELEKEAEVLKEKLKQNQPAVSNPSGSNPSGSNPSGSNPSGSNPSGSAPVPSIRANQTDLAKSGLIIKKGDVQAPGASISTELLEVAKKIQGIPGFDYFSGFNDRFHQEEAPNSLHTQGLAADFTLKQRPSRDEGKKLIAQLKSLGATKAIDEYNNKSPHATGGHIHVEVAGKGIQAASGGVFDGPKSGYAATLHGREAVIPLKDGAVPVSMSQEFNMTATNLGELVAIMKSNVGMQERMLTVLDEIRRVQTTTADNTGKMVTYASN